MILNTERLTMTVMQPSDWPFFCAVQQQDEVMRYISDPASEQEIRDRFDKRLPPWQDGELRYFIFVLRTLENQQQIGLFGGFAVAGASEAELGYMLISEAQGQGYAKEALLALIEYAVGELGYQAITARVAEGNLASVALLKKFGFEFVEKKHTDLILKGEPVADLLFRLKGRDWLKSSATKLS